MFNFIPVSFFFVNFRVRVRVRDFGFGIGNLKHILIGGAAGTVDIPVRQMPV